MHKPIKSERHFKKGIKRGRRKMKFQVNKSFTGKKFYFERRSEDLKSSVYVRDHSFSVQIQKD